MINTITTILCYIVISPPLVQKNSGKNISNTIFFFTLTLHFIHWTSSACDWHKLVTDLFYDFVSILLVWVAKLQNAIELENISNLITSPSSYQCRKTTYARLLLVHFVILGRHTSMECMSLCVRIGDPQR